MKISAALIAWNEVDTIDLCLKSLKGFVDEVIIADTGSFDGTLEKVEEYLSRFELNGEVIKVNVKTLGQARRIALEKATHPWILLIDANLVLSGALKKELLKTSEVGVISKVRSLNLMGDYIHYFTPLAYHDHHNTLFRKTDIVWGNDLDRPWPKKPGYKLKSWAVNLSRVRPAWRYWYRGETFAPESGREWRTPGNRQLKWINASKYESLIEYVEAEEGLTFEEVKDIAPNWFLGMLRKFAKPLSPKIKEQLPETIQVELKNPRYKLIYKGSELVGRHPSL